MRKTNSRLPLNKISLTIFLVISAYSLNAQTLFRNKADDYYNEAKKEYNLKHYKKSAQLAKQSISERPYFSDAQILLSKCFMQTNKLDSALFEVKEILERDPKYRDAYVQAANVEIKQRHYEEALCFVEDGLYYYPIDRYLQLKRLTILDAINDVYNSTELAEKLINKYPNDSTVRNAYVDHKITTGNYYMRRKNSILGIANYEKALAVDPNNIDAKQYLLSAYNKGGDYQLLMNKINADLSANPKSYPLLIKKAGLLQDMFLYAEAITVLNKASNLFPSSPAKKLLSNLKLEAAQFYTLKDPYALYESILAESPGNREVFNKFIALNVSREQYNTALIYINKTLKSNPNEEYLLGNKMDILSYQRKFTEAARIAENLWKRNGKGNKYRENVVDLKIASARSFAAEQLADSALIEYQIALSASPKNKDVFYSLINIYEGQKNYAKALNVVDNALAFYPSDENLLKKKSAILFDSGAVEEALAVTNELLRKHPYNSNYEGIYLEQNLSQARILMQKEDYEGARILLQNVVRQEPNNLEAINYLVNLESATKNYDAALEYLNTALGNNNQNKDLLLKKSSVLEEMHNYKAAYAITNDLMMRYPYKTDYKIAYLNQRLLSGRELQKSNDLDSALVDYKKVLEISPSDSMALIYTINTYLQKNNDDSTINYINNGLKYYPNSVYFRTKRTAYLESKFQWEEAALSADTLVKLSPTIDHIEYAALLKSKLLKNQFGLYFSNTSFDDTGASFNVASMDYRHFYNKGSYAAKINYAARNLGTGIQGDFEVYYSHTKKLYSYASLAISNQNIFPHYNFKYSIFPSINKSIEAEIGLRYLHSSALTTKSVALGLSKTYKDFWFNLRGFIVQDQTKNYYQNISLNNRYYMNNAKEFVSVVVGIGNSPDDLSTLIQFPSLINATSKYVGVGYQKTFLYKTTLGIFTTWTNQKINEVRYRNQYDLNFVFMRKF